MTYGGPEMSGQNQINEATDNSDDPSLLISYDSCTNMIITYTVMMLMVMKRRNVNETLL